MNLPNRITIFRLIIPIFFLPAIMLNFPGSKLIALILFTIGTISDWLDGYIARKYNMTSDFGKLMDPLADKIMVSSALVAFVVVVPEIVKVWMVVIIISRDFMITGLRLLALQSNYVISADKAGKHKTAWQMVAIISVLVFLAFQDVSQYFPTAITDTVNVYVPIILIVLYYCIVGLTMFSGCLYMWKHRALYVKHV